MPIEILSPEHLYTSWTAQGAATLEAFNREEGCSSLNVAAAPFLIVAALIEGVAKGALALVVLLPHLLCGVGSEFFEEMGYGFVASLVTAGVLLPALLFTSCCCADDGRVFQPQVAGQQPPAVQHFGNAPTIPENQLPPHHTLTLNPKRAATDQAPVDLSAPDVDFAGAFMPLLEDARESGALKGNIGVDRRKLHLRQFLDGYRNILEMYNEWARMERARNKILELQNNTTARVQFAQQAAGNKDVAQQIATTPAVAAGIAGRLRQDPNLIDEILGHEGNGNFVSPEQLQFLAYLRDRAQYFQTRYQAVVQGKLTPEETAQIKNAYFHFDPSPGDNMPEGAAARQQQEYQQLNARQQAAIAYYRELVAFFFD